MVKDWRVKGTAKRFPENIKQRRGPAVDFFLDSWIRLISFSKTRVNLICVDRDIPTCVRLRYDCVLSMYYLKLCNKSLFAVKRIRASQDSSKTVLCHYSFTLLTILYSYYL